MTIRPFRFVYLFGLTITAFVLFGLGAAVLVTLATFDLEFT